MLPEHDTEQPQIDMRALVIALTDQRNRALDEAAHWRAVASTEHLRMVEQEKEATKE